MNTYDYILKINCNIKPPINVLISGFSLGYSGCRRVEALNVRWDDIDLKNNYIHIKGTKTLTSDRYIPIFKDLKNLLDTMPVKSGKVFHHRPDYVTKDFKKHCSNHKLHDLRHTFATRCLECGINIKVIQQLLGHADIQTTINTYSHCLPTFVQNECLKLKF